MIKTIILTLVVGVLLFELIEHVVFPLFWFIKERKRRSVCGVSGMLGKVGADKSIAETLNGQIVLILDTANGSRVQYPEEAIKEGIASVLSVPIAVKGQIIGVLRIYTAEQRNFSDDEYKLISGLAAISVMIVLMVAGHMIVD